MVNHRNMENIIALHSNDTNFDIVKQRLKSNKILVYIVILRPIKNRLRNECTTSDANPHRKLAWFFIFLLFIRYHFNVTWPIITNHNIYNAS